MSQHLHRKTGNVSPNWINIISNRRAQRLLISFAKRGSLGSVHLVKSTNNWGFEKYDVVVWNGSKWFRIGHKFSSLTKVLKFRRPSKWGNYWLADWLFSRRIIFHMFPTSKHKWSFQSSHIGTRQECRWILPRAEFNITSWRLTEKLS